MLSFKFCLELHDRNLYPLENKDKSVIYTLFTMLKLIKNSTAV